LKKFSDSLQLKKKQIEGTKIEGNTLSQNVNANNEDIMEIKSKIANLSTGMVRQEGLLCDLINFRMLSEIY
jgi:hypothetical protein